MDAGKELLSGEDVEAVEENCHSALITRRLVGSGLDLFECNINEDTLDQLVCRGYKCCYWKMTLTFLGVISSCGFLLLIFYWRPDWRLKCTYSRSTFKDATAVYLKTTDGTNQIFVSDIQLLPMELAYLMNNRYPLQKEGGTRENCLDDLYGGAYSSSDMIKFFNHQSSKFIWNSRLGTFVELGSLDGQATLEDIHRDSKNALGEEEYRLRTELFGMNLITVTVPSYFQLLWFEVLNPFYIFQLFAVIFWMFDEYYIYSTAIFIISIASAITSLIEIRGERVRLHNMVEHHNEMKVDVLRQTEEGTSQIQIWSKELVPGDVIVVPPGGVQLACDAALVSGTCIVNESMLTGESVPVTKTPLPSGESELKQVYNTEQHKRHTLFCGTQVVQTRYYRGELVKAVVVRTGYNTAKGRLVHSILYPKPVDMKLLRDGYRFVAVLFAMAMCGFVYTVVVQYLAKASAKEIAFNAIDLITISVPPALPLAMTIGIIYAQRRLKKQQIHCISPQRINISGQVDVAAFDKTGTLTEDGLDLSTVLPVSQVPSENHLKFMNPIDPNKIKDLCTDNELLRCMASCHTLTIIDGSITGDPLDVKMFEATRWRLLEPEVDEENKYDQLLMTFVRPPSDMLKKLTDHSSPDVFDADNSQGGSNETSAFDLGIVRQFPFSSDLQRSSVIMKSGHSSHLLVYLKGAPEMVVKLCRDDSVPEDFADILKEYTRQGFRMIGLAYKELHATWLKAQKLERDLVECDLTFIGLVALENKLKPESPGALMKLKKANIRTLMVTGDNILTSLCVAREAGLMGVNDKVVLATTTPGTPSTPPTLTWNVDDYSDASTLWSCSPNEELLGKQDNTTPHRWHIAVTGDNFSVIKDNFPEWMEVVAAKGAVFARMSPSQKTSLMEELQKIDYHVCMCGDGANDCGALKRAHTGVSLSEYEASVAAPFTSHTDLGIECVPTLIREGRAALVTSFGMFKFMALYSLIQFSSVTLLYDRLSSLGDMQYLYIDLIVIDVIALTMSRNHAYRSLNKNPPPSSLVSVEMLFSLMMQIVFQIAAQLIIFFFVQEQCWYTDKTPAEASNMTIGDNKTCPALNNVPDQSKIHDEDNILMYETSAVFLLSCYLYLSVSIAFSRGPPFRTPMYKNRWFITSLMFLYAFTVFLTFFSPLELDNLMMIRKIPDTNFLVILVAIAAIHLVVSVIFELVCIEQPSLWKWLRSIFRRFHSNRATKRYKYLLTRLNYCKSDFHHVTESGQSSICNPLLVLDQTLWSQRKQESILIKSTS